MHSTLTVLFVSSMHIYHTKPSLDPIFHATELRYFDGLREPYYYNADPRARALACVDTSELCSPDGKTCWSMITPLPPDFPSDSSYWLMKWSLRNSNIYDSIKWRLGTALLAQESISQSISDPLSLDQWLVEASQLFATSLAHIQYDAWGIAVGEGRERPGYIEITPEEAKGRLCKLYKFKTADYTNVNLAAFVGLPLLGIAIFVLSWDAKTVGLTISAREGDDPLSKPLVIDAIFWLTWAAVTTIIVGICSCVVSLLGKLKMYMQGRRHGFEAAESSAHRSCNDSPETTE